MAYFEVSKARDAARKEEFRSKQDEANAACASHQQDEPNAACANNQQDEPGAPCAKTLNPDNDPLKYTEIPNHYVWDNKNCQWNKRQRRAKGGEVIRRMYHCSPKRPEMYA